MINTSLIDQLIYNRLVRLSHHNLKRFAAAFEKYCVNLIMSMGETLKKVHAQVMEDDSGAAACMIYKTDTLPHLSLTYNRKDFYKIALIKKRKGILNYADKKYQVSRNFLSFFNPVIPYSWQPQSEENEGYCLIFTDEFLGRHPVAAALIKEQMFTPNGNHVFDVDKKTMKLLVKIFEQMISEIATDYINKYDLVCHYMQIIVHEAYKMMPLKIISEHAGDATARVSNNFFYLLESEFTIEPEHPGIQIKTASEFAAKLAIHPNYLNRLLKRYTGKTTTTLIAERLLREAKSLLLQGHLDVAQIAWSLGFENPSNFNAFFKRFTQVTPTHFRRDQVSY